MSFLSQHKEETVLVSSLQLGVNNGDMFCDLSLSLTIRHRGNARNNYFAGRGLMLENMTSADLSNLFTTRQQPDFVEPKPSIYNDSCVFSDG